MCLIYSSPRSLVRRKVHCRGFEGSLVGVMVDENILRCLQACGHVRLKETVKWGMSMKALAPRLPATAFQRRTAGTCHRRVRTGCQTGRPM